MQTLMDIKRFSEIVNNFQTLNSFLVVGDVGVDKYTSGNVRRISPEAPVPVLQVEKEWLKLGLAANVSDNLKSLGVDSTLCGVIGEDVNANLFENLLEESHLKTWGLIRDENRMTTVKERVTAITQQICRVDYESTSEVPESTIVRLLARIDSFLEEHHSLIVQDYGKGMVTRSLMEQLIEKANEKKKFIAVDPSRHTDPMVYKGVDLLKPNKVESKILAAKLGHHGQDLTEIANFLVEKLQLKKLVITLGGEGMALLDTEASGKVETIPTVASEVFDVSGAGDTVISALQAALGSGATLNEAAWIGNCAAGVVVGKRGTACVTTKELTEYFEKLKAGLQ